MQTVLLGNGGLIDVRFDGFQADKVVDSALFPPEIGDNADLLRAARARRREDLLQCLILGGVTPRHAQILHMPVDGVLLRLIDPDDRGVLTLRALGTV